MAAFAELRVPVFTYQSAYIPIVIEQLANK
jgi:hypothetical protein